MSVATSTAIGIAATVVGAGATLGGALISADAAGKQGAQQEKASQDQLSFQREALQKQIDQRADTLKQAKAAAAMSPDEVKSINSILSTRGEALAKSQASIQKQQASLDAIDPQVKAAGKNVLQLLSGKAADTLKPMQDQMKRQRQDMVNNLSATLGPGFATSSAGIEALTRFDQNAAMAVSQAQQQALSTVTQSYSSLFGAQQQGQNAITSQIGNAFASAQQADATVLGAEQNVKSRELNAVIGGTNASPIDFEAPARGQQSVINSAGNAFAGQAGAGGGLAGAGSVLAGAGGLLIGKGSGPSSGGTPSAFLAQGPQAENFMTGMVAQNSGPSLFNK